MAWMLSKDEAEAIVGRALPEEAFTFVPFGHRVVIVREEPVKVTPAGIVIPDSALEYLCVGWVIAAGHLVGQPRSDTPHWCPLDGGDLLGQKVLFGTFAGSGLLLGTDTIGGASRYDSAITVLNDGDIWGTIKAPQVGDQPGDLVPSTEVDESVGQHIDREGQG